jgi:hypothetical protein
MNSQSNAYKLLGILQNHAPTGKEQQCCSELANAMEADNLSELQMETLLAGCLLDGLQHGNWPWVHRAESR